MQIEESEINYIKQRNQIIKENNYENTEVFAILREARKVLYESDFIKLLFLLEHLCNGSKEMSDECFWEIDRYKIIIPWFIKLFDLLASGEKTFEIRYQIEYDFLYDHNKESINPDEERFTIYAKWEHMNKMIDLHYFDIFPIWYQCPLEEIDF